MSSWNIIIRKLFTILMMKIKSLKFLIETWHFILNVGRWSNSITLWLALSQHDIVVQDRLKGIWYVCISYHLSTVVGYGRKKIVPFSHKYSNNAHIMILTLFKYFMLTSKATSMDIELYTYELIRITHKKFLKFNLYLFSG